MIALGGHLIGHATGTQPLFVAGTARPDDTSIRWAEEVGALRQSTKGRLSVLDDALRVQARRRRLRRGGLAVVTLLLFIYLLAALLRPEWF